MSIARQFSIITLAMAALLFSTTASSTDVQHLQALQSTDYHFVESESIGRGFHIYVRLPPGYEKGTKKYPTVYTLDGGNLFSLFAGYNSYLNLANESPEVILVGISYGSDSYEDGNHRGSDFTAPSREREHYGGASAFQSFFRDGIIPLIESNNRSRSDRRVIFGHSLGGQFVLFTAQTDPNLFWGHIASNPALHRNLDLFLEMAPNGRSKARVFLAGAENDDRRFLVPRQKWVDHWSAKKEIPWELKVANLPGQSHLSSPPEAFRLGMSWLFGSE